VRKKLGLVTTEEYGMKISAKNVLERISVPKMRSMRQEDKIHGEEFHNVNFPRIALDQSRH
jgi:hypothetical protein